MPTNLRHTRLGGRFGTLYAATGGTPGAGVPGGSSLLTDLAGYWKLDEASGTRNDSVGTSHLTDVNTVTSNPGKVGTAAQFTAANTESLTVAHNAALAVGNFDFSIACWVYFTTVTTSIFVSKWSAGQASYTLYYDSGAGNFIWLLSSDGTATDVTIQMNVLGTPIVATWYFMTLIHDAAANQITVQGNATTAQVVAHSAGVFAGTAPFELGARAGVLPLDGRVDEAGYWKKVLSAAERAALYGGGSGAAYPFTGLP
jgi:hypothetical protein